jgi:hypothetical protein
VLRTEVCSSLPKRTKKLQFKNNMSQQQKCLRYIFICAQATFLIIAVQFGPLLVGKSKEGYLEYKHPENYEKFGITNVGLIDAEVDFILAKDTASQGVFTISPSSMKLKPGETHDLTVWAYPKNVGIFEVFLIKLLLSLICWL